MDRPSQITVDSEILEQTSEALRRFGDLGCEGLVLWLGRTDENTWSVEELLVPPQKSLRDEDGVGYFITSDTLFSLNKLLSKTGLRLLAQVHSHPGRAYHSYTDDQYCIVTTDGGLSIVVPDFGFGPADLFEWAVYRLNKSQWEELSIKEVKDIFTIE